MIITETENILLINLKLNTMEKIFVSILISLNHIQSYALTYNLNQNKMKNDFEYLLHLILKKNYFAEHLTLKDSALFAKQ